MNRIWKLQSPINVLGLLPCLALQVAAQNWMLTSAPLTNWFAIAASADGTKIFAAVNDYPYYNPKGGPIYVSTNAGTNWTLTGAPVTNWIAVACSADGTRVIAASAMPPNSGPAGNIYLSSDSGA